MEQRQNNLKSSKSESEFWTFSEFKDIISVSPATLKKLLKDGEIKGAHRFGTQWRIHKESFYNQIKEENKNGR